MRQNIFFQYGCSFLMGISLGLVILIMNCQIMWIVVFLAICLGIISVRFPDIILAIFLIGTLFIPNEILPFLSATNTRWGFGPVRLHPAGIAIFVGSLLIIFIKREMISEKFKQFKALKIIFILMIPFFISISFQTFFFRGLKGIPQCLENYVFPFIFFLYLLTVNQKKLYKFLKVYVFIIFILSIYALIEYTFKHNFIYHYLYSNSYVEGWYYKFLGSIYRTTTSIGHPLKNGLYFLFSIPISVYIFRKPFNLISPIILSLAILTTGSRMAFFVCIIAIILCYISTRFNVLEFYKTALATIIIALLFYLMLFKLSLGNTLLTRFYEAQASTLIRLDTLGNSLFIIKDNFIFGKGMGLSSEISSALFKIKSGFENPWIMLISDVGFITTLLYVGIVLLIAKTRIYYIKFKNISRGIFISFISILLMLSSFNSFGSRSTLNFLLWFNIALLFVFIPQKKTFDNTQNYSL